MSAPVLLPRGNVWRMPIPDLGLWWLLVGPFWAVGYLLAWEVAVLGWAFYLLGALAILVFMACGGWIFFRR